MYLREELGLAQPSVWTLMLEFGLGHEPIAGYARGALLVGDTIRYESVDPPEWQMQLEACRYLCGLWGRLQDDTTAGALRSYVSGRTGHLRAAEPAVQAVRSASALAPMVPTRPPVGVARLVAARELSGRRGPPPRSA